MSTSCRKGASAQAGQEFVNALRECLGFEPLYPGPRQSDAQRFYVPSHEARRARTPWRGSETTFHGGGGRGA